MKVLFGGAFDLLHIGHVMAIKKAKSLCKFGDKLVIHVASDLMVRNKKGAGRPVIPQHDRYEMVRAIHGVSYVVMFKDWEYLDLPKLLDTVQPDVLVLTLGEERLYNEVWECEKRGIKIVEIARQIPKSGLDTTKIIAKLRWR